MIKQGGTIMKEYSERILQFTYEINSVQDYIFEESILDFDSFGKMKKAAIDVINGFPSEIIEKMIEANWKVEITNTKHLEEIYHVPYEIDGITDYKNKIIFLYPRQSAIYKALPHEIGHFVDENLGNLSENPKWLWAFHQLKSRYLGSDLWDSLNLTAETASSKEIFAELLGSYLIENNEAIPRQYCLAKDVQYYCRDCMQYMGKTVDAYISDISQITKITIETNLAELSCAALNDSWA